MQRPLTVLYFGRNRCIFVLISPKTYLNWAKLTCFCIDFAQIACFI